ncbi:MAG: hypothetical protein ACR2FM_05445 [Candidatus Saccharimonadales bacterium]
MQVYKSKYSKIAGTSYQEVVSQARKEYNHIRKQTKRQPYVRSRYYKDKVFIKLFWDHLYEKNRGDIERRLRYYDCAIDLLRNNVNQPISTASSDKANGISQRFIGKTTDGDIFYVQVKQNKRTGRKDFISLFPG